MVEQRALGFHEALDEAGVEAHPELIRLKAGWEPASAVPIAERLLNADQRPDAILCSTDLLALATIHTARGLGLQVPGDVAVCGFDDLPFSQFTDPGLTTVRIPAFEMGREAARILIEHLRGDRAETPAEQIEFPVELLVRDST